RERDADRSAEAARPGSARADDHRCRDASALGHHTLDPARDSIDAANRALTEDLCTAPLSGSSDRRRGAAGLGARVACGVQRSAPAPIIGSEDCGELLRIEKSGVEAMLARDAQPPFEASESLVVLRKVERSTLPEADVTQFLAQLQPQLQAAHHQG